MDRQREHGGRPERIALVAMVVAIVLILALQWAFSDTTRDGLLIQPVAPSSPRSQWEALGSITAQGATPAVSARDYSTIHALTTTAVLWKIPRDGAVHEFRFRTDADADNHVVEFWLASSSGMKWTALEEVYTHGLTLDLTGGTADAYGSSTSSYGDFHFVDTILATDDGILEDAYQIVNSGAGTEDQAVIRVRFRGWEELAIINTTFDGGSTALYVDGRQYSQ